MDKDKRIRDAINEYLLHDIMFIETYLDDALGYKLGMNERIIAVYPKGENFTRLQVTTERRENNKFKTDKIDIITSELGYYMNSLDSDLNISANINKDSNIKIYDSSIYYNEKSYILKPAKTKRQAEIAGILKLIRLHNTALEAEVKRDYNSEWRKKSSVRKGDFGEDIVRKRILTVVKMYPDLNIDLMTNQIENQPHTFDKQLINRDNGKIFAIDIKSKKMRDGYFFDQGIDERVAKKYRKLPNMTLILVDHFGYVDERKMKDANFSYKDSSFSIDLINQERGAIYGGLLSNLELPVSFSMKSVETKGKEVRRQYPITRTSKKDGKEITYFPIPKMKLLTELLEEMFDYKGLDKNLSFLNKSERTILRALSRTM